MSNNRQPNNPGNQSRGAFALAAVIIGLTFGALLGAGIHRFMEWKGIWQFVATGALLGGTAGLCWRAISNVWERFRSEDWEVKEIEIETLGQKWKLASASSQRRVAWSLFVETATRIGTQSTSDAEGDDGVALKSLYDLFQSTRNSISEIEPTRLLPSREQGTDTVETYALAMLNQDLRPFLSKWHPTWDAWQKANPDNFCTHWEHHAIFREELKTLQQKIRMRAQGLGQIAGVPQIGRFMDVAPSLENTRQDQ